MAGRGRKRYLPAVVDVFSRRVPAHNVAITPEAIHAKEVIEQALAHDGGKTLLVLDTITGSTADHLYTRLGWERVSEIPDYALMPQGGLRGTTVFYRRLDGQTV